LEKIPEKSAREVQMALSIAIVFLGTVTSVMGDFEEGDRLLQQGLTMKQTLEDNWGSAFCLRQISLSAYYRGDYISSSRALQQSLEISQCRRPGHRMSIPLNELMRANLMLRPCFLAEVWISLRLPNIRGRSYSRH
jgi:hypothetical protein